MNSFMFDELVAREYRRDRMAEAEKYRLEIRPATQSIKYRFCRKMTAFGKRLETVGEQMQQHFESIESKIVATTK